MPEDNSNRPASAAEVAEVRSLIDNLTKQIAGREMKTAPIGSTALATRPEPKALFEDLRKKVEELDNVTGVDEEPNPTEGVGRIDLALGQLMADQQDRRGVWYRLFDKLPKEAQQFIAALVRRRYQDKDRSLVARDIQKVREAYEWAMQGTGDGWHNLHLAAAPFIRGGAHG